MIKALQKKFIFTAMTAVTVLLLVILGALNVFNSISSNRQSFRLIEELGRQGDRTFSTARSNYEELSPPPPSVSYAEAGSWRSRETATSFSEIFVSSSPSRTRFAIRKARVWGSL